MTQRVNAKTLSKKQQRRARDHETGAHFVARLCFEAFDRREVKRIADEKRIERAERVTERGDQDETQADDR